MATLRRLSHSSSASCLTSAVDSLAEEPFAYTSARPMSLHQGHALILVGSVFHRMWVEVRGDSAHLFPHVTSSRPSQVIPRLRHCDIKMSSDQEFREGYFVVKVQSKKENDDQLSLYFSTEEEATIWAAMLSIPSAELEGLNLECGIKEENVVRQAGAKSELDQQPSEEDLLSRKICREELLQNLLRSKKLLEQKLQRIGTVDWETTAAEVINKYARVQSETQRDHLRNSVLLRQRKNSTAIKMATLERLQVHRKPPLVKDAAVEGANEKVVNERLYILRQRLSAIDSQLNETEKDAEKRLEDLDIQRYQDLALLQDFCGMPAVQDVSAENVAKITPKGKKKPLKVGRRMFPRENVFNFLDFKRPLSRRYKSSEALNQASRTTNIWRSRSAQRYGHEGKNSFNCGERSPAQNEVKSESTIRTEISPEALAEIEAFKQFIEDYFRRQPRDGLADAMGYL